MTIEDALNILQGEDNAATMYFQEKTSEQLMSTFKPIIETAMTEVGVTKLYQTLEDRVTGAGSAWIRGVAGHRLKSVCHRQNS